MPKKSPQNVIDEAIRLYADGYSSTVIGHKLSLSYSAVLGYIRKSGVPVRSQSESKNAHYRKNPIPLAPLHKEKVYGEDVGSEKICASCSESFPADFDHFYRRTRANGRVYLTSLCKGCIKKQRQDHRIENPDVVRDQTRKSYDKNKDGYNQQRRYRRMFDPDAAQEQRDKNRMWFANNPEHVIIYRRAYLEENMESIRSKGRIRAMENKPAAKAWSRNRKARIKGAAGKFTPSDVSKKLADQGSKCFWCCADVSGEYHIDHYIPVAKGGSNHPENIVISCPTCNVSRGAKMPDEFIEYRKFVAENQDKIDSRRAYMSAYMRKSRARR